MGEDVNRVDRRSFLKGAVVAGVGAALGGTLAGCASSAPPQAAAVPAAAAKAPAAAPTAVAAAPTAAPAAVSWPEKNKTMSVIVPWPAGGAPDVSTRLVVEMYKKELGINVEVLNKDGAGSQVGTTEFVKAKPDGYTLLGMSVPTAPLIYLDPERQASFTRKSFEPIAVYAVDPYSFGVLTDAKWKTLQDLIDDAKANPGKIRIGTNGYMNTGHLLIVNLMKAAGVKFTLAHFDGGGTNATALLGGHTDVCCTGPTMAKYAKDGKARVLAVSTEKQSALFPGVKTFKEQGYDVSAYVTRGHVAPAGTPKDVIDKLAAVVKMATEDANFKTKMAAAGSDTQFWGPDQYASDWDKQDKEVQAALAEVKATK